MRIKTTTLPATTVLAAAGLALATAGLAACGSTDGSHASDAYCKELRTDKAYFQSLASADPDLSKLGEVFERMHALAAAAPAATTADWKTIDSAATSFQDALSEAGLDFADLAAIQQGDLPADVDVDKVTAAMPKLAAFGGPQMEAAAAAIDKHAQKTCGFALTKS
jgi:hypothetical protein